MTRRERLNVIVAVVILLNIVSMTIEADYPYEPCFEPLQGSFPYEPCQLWAVVNGCFLVFFCVEMAIRLFAFGCRRFFTIKDEWLWNIFDACIVIMGLGDQSVCHFFDQGRQPGGVGHLMMMMRVVRILRVLRVLRLIKNVQELFVLALAMLEALRTSFWIAMLMVMLMLVGAILCTTVIGHNATRFEVGPGGAGICLPDLDDPDFDLNCIRSYWGSTLASMFTLFQLLTFDNWSAVARVVVESLPIMRIFFMCFIVVAAFAILSLLTGVVADHMNECSDTTKTTAQRVEVESLEGALGDVKEAFIRMAASRELRDSPRGKGFDGCASGKGGEHGGAAQDGQCDRATRLSRLSCAVAELLQSQNDGLLPVGDEPPARSTGPACTNGRGGSSAAMGVHPLRHVDTFDAHEDEDLKLDQEEFVAVVGNDFILNKMKELKLMIKPSEVKDLWDALDLNSDGYLSWKEFKDVLLRFRQEPTARDMLKMQGVFHRMHTQLTPADGARFAEQRLEQIVLLMRRTEESMERINCEFEGFLKFLDDKKREGGEEK